MEFKGSLIKLRRPKEPWGGLIREADPFLRWTIPVVVNLAIAIGVLVSKDGVPPGC